MRKLAVLSVVASMLGVLVSLALAAAPTATKKPLFNSTGFRPDVTFNDFPVVSSSPAIAVSGVVFSHAPVDRVTIAGRTAVLRVADPKDLMKLQRVPEGAGDAPHRTYFELRDVNLPRVGANDLEIRAVDADGRASDVHRITVVRLTNAPAEPAR